MTTQFGTGIAGEKTGQETGTKTAQAAMAELDGSEPDFLVVFCSSAYEYEEVLAGIRAVTGETPLIGSSTAGEFTDTAVGEDRVALAAISSDEMQFFTGIGTGLREDPQAAVESAADSFPDDLDGYPHEAGINLHDGLTGRGEEIAMLAYQQRPMPYAGGSAGDDAGLDETVVFCDGEVASDAVALALIASEKPLSLSVEFGHEPISEPITVTHADGSVVHELDGDPAFDVWETHVREHAREVYDVDTTTLDAEHPEFTKMLTRFEFGLETGGDQKIRWPGLTPNTDGPLHFATAIPEDTEVTITHSSKDAQIEAARESARKARESMDGETPAGALVFDCFCQGAILGDQFDQSVQAMVEELDAPLAGFQTYGEICMREGEMRGYHNTTSSTIVIPE